MDAADPKTLISLLAGIVALISLWSTIAHRRERVTTLSMKEMEDRLRDTMKSDKLTLEARIGESLTKSAENNADISRMRLELEIKLRNMVTKEDMSELLNLMLDPIKNHMRRQEAFTEEILRAGLLRRDFDRNQRGG